MIQLEVSKANGFMDWQRVSFTGRSTELVALLERLRMAGLIDSSLRQSIDFKEVQQAIAILKQDR